MNIQKIKGFCTAARCGSFSKAADSLFMTQPAFSRMISSMEEELGCTLFERGRTETVLTSAGKKILPEMEEIVERYEKVAHSASDYKPHSGGSIVIGEFRFGWADESRQLCAEWMSKGLGADIKIKEVSGTNVFAMGRSGEIDFLHTIYTPEKYQPFLAALPAKTYSHYAYLPEGHRLAGCEDVSLKDLKDENFMFFERNQFPLMYKRVASACAEEGFIPHVTYESDNKSMMLDRVSASEGIAVLPGFISARPGIVRVRIREIPPERSYWFWWKENTRPETLRFIEFLKEKLGTDDTAL